MTGKSIYSNIIVIGYGRVTGEVIDYVCSLREKYGYSLSYIEHEVHDFNQAMKVCRENNIPYKTIEDRTELTERFGIISEKTLIISASNNYLFPKKIVEKENLTIINFHNALLPDLPGRNAPSWAIYEERKETGITWHYVNANVDAGDIIVQKTCEIEDDEKAYALADKLMHMATEAFEECIESVLTGEASASKQSISKTRRIYKSSELPGNGRISTTDPPESIYRVLRSMDYGKTGVFPEVRIELADKEAVVKRYKVIPEMPDSQKENTLYLPLNDKWLQIKYGD